MKPITLIALAAIACSSTTALAQGTNPLVGRWTIEYERGRQMENGVVTPIMGKGNLSITMRGDTLVATITPGLRPDGTIPPPATVSGKMTADGAVFVQKTSAQVNMNGDARTVEITMTWTLRANRDELTGTLARELPMMPEASEPTPVKGTRITG